MQVVLFESLPNVVQCGPTIMSNREDLSKGSKWSRILDIVTVFNVFIHNFVPRYSKP